MTSPWCPLSSARQLYKARYGGLSDQPKQGGDYSNAPTGTLREKLDNQRQGQSQYGTIGKRFMENPVEMMALLGMPFAGPTGMARTMGSRITQQQMGQPSLSQAIRNLFYSYTQPQNVDDVMTRSAFDMLPFIASLTNRQPPAQ